MAKQARDVSRRVEPICRLISKFLGKEIHCGKELIYQINPENIPKFSYPGRQEFNTGNGSDRLRGKFFKESYKIQENFPMICWRLTLLVENFLKILPRLDCRVWPQTYRSKVWLVKYHASRYSGPGWNYLLLSGSKWTFSKIRRAFLCFTCKNFFIPVLFDDLYSDFGGRIPGVWFVSLTNQLYICTGFNGNEGRF